MTVQQLIDEIGLTPLHLSDPGREVTSGYCGDLLSWVMGRAQAGCAWVTIMTNVNTIAVAVLADCACVIIAEQAELDPQALSRARQQDVCVLTSAEDSFSLCARIARALES